MAKGNWFTKSLGWLGDRKFGVLRQLKSGKQAGVFIAPGLLVGLGTDPNSPALIIGTLVLQGLCILMGGLEDMADKKKG